MNKIFTRFDEMETAANLKKAADHWEQLTDRAARSASCTRGGDDHRATALADALCEAFRAASKALRLAEMVAGHHEAWACCPGVSTATERNVRALHRERSLNDAQTAVSKAVHVDYCINEGRAYTRTVAVVVYDDTEGRETYHCVYGADEFCREREMPHNLDYRSDPEVSA